MFQLIGLNTLIFLQWDKSPCVHQAPCTYPPSHCELQCEKLQKHSLQTIISPEKVQTNTSLSVLLVLSIFAKESQHMPIRNLNKPTRITVGRDLVPIQLNNIQYNYLTIKGQISTPKITK
jgi:hypothetical protein